MQVQKCNFKRYTTLFSSTYFRFFHLNHLSTKFNSAFDCFNSIFPRHIPICELQNKDPSTYLYTSGTYIWNILSTKNTLCILPRLLLMVILHINCSNIDKVYKKTQFQHLKIYFHVVIYVEKTLRNIDYL